MKTALMIQFKQLFHIYTSTFNPNIPDSINNYISKKKDEEEEEKQQQ